MRPSLPKPMEERSSISIRLVIFNSFFSYMIPVCEIRFLATPSIVDRFTLMMDSFSYSPRNIEIIPSFEMSLEARFRETMLLE